MKIGPKYKIARRLGPDVFEKTQGEKFALSEARKKKGRGMRRRRMSNYGLQLIQKQRARFMYGITEKQFRNYVLEAVDTDGAQPADMLYQLLETRLDNTVYRLGLAPTRRSARQMVSHGHLMVNGKKLTVPSHRVKQGDVITVREGSRDSVLFTNLTETLAEKATPEWLNFNVGLYEGKVVGMPQRPSIGLAFDVVAILEFYSR